MSKYDLGIIDGQYILRRNLSIQARMGKVNENLLLKSFMQSIMKEKRELEFDKALICWDKSPYFSQLEGIEEYKADRHYTNYDEVEKLKETLLWETDEEKRKELEKEIHYKDIEAWNNQISAKVKYFIIDNLGKFGFYSLIKRCWEADNLSFALAEKCSELGLKGILVSQDQDWTAFRNKNVQFITPERKGKRDNKFGHVRWLLDFSKSLNIPLYEIGVLKELYDSSHNNVNSYEFKDMVKFEEFATKIYNHDETLPGFEGAFRKYSAMNIRKHIPEVTNLVDFSLSRTDLASTLEWQHFLNERQINISWSTYEKFRRNCNKNYLEA